MQVGLAKACYSYTSQTEQQTQQKQSSLLASDLEELGFDSQF